MHASRPARHAPKPTATRYKPALCCAAVAALALGIAGCREKSQSQRTFEDAVRQLTTGVSGEQNPEAYARVVSSLATSGGNADDPAAEETALLRSVARVSEGIAALTELDGAIARAGVLLKDARSAAEARGIEHQIAAATASVNYEDAIASLRDEIDAREREIADLQSTRAMVEASISDLEARAASLETEASELREQAADRQLAASASPVEAAEVAPEVRRVNRRADALEQQAARLRIGVSTQRSELPLIDARIEQRRSQRELLAERIESNRERAAEAREQANAALARAAEAETDLVEALDAALAASGVGPGDDQAQAVLGSAERTARAFEAAIADARRARTRAQARSNVAVAVAAGLLGETHQRLLASLERDTRFVANLLRADPPLGNSDELQSVLERLRDLTARAASDAAEAYDSAASALGSIRASDQGTRERITESAERYQALAASFRAPEPESEGDRPGESGTTAPGVPQRGGAASERE